MLAGAARVFKIKGQLSAGEQCEPDGNASANRR
jgi:hypothetical protein